MDDKSAASMFIKTLRLEEFLLGSYEINNPQLLSEIAVYKVENKPIYPEHPLTKTKISFQMTDIYKLSQCTLDKKIFESMNKSGEYISHDPHEFFTICHEDSFDLGNIEFPIQTVEGLHVYGFYKERKMDFSNKKFFYTYLKNCGKFDCINAAFLSRFQLNDLGRGNRYTVLLSPISAFAFNNVLHLNFYPASYSKRNAPLVAA